MSRLFGTDGVRGLANRELTAALALGLAQASAVVLTKGHHAEARRAEGRRPVAVVARDPRISGEFITAAVSAGLASSGVDVLDAGVIPTPAAAFLVDDIGADFGVMISASHNPAPDNGIKFFAFGGTKLPDEVEDRIEAAMSEPQLMPVGGDVGRIRRFADAEDRYVLHLLGALPNRLDGIHVVLDCAHGAASAVSPEVFTDAGAEDHPDRGRPRRHEHQRRRGLDPPRQPGRRRARARRRRRHRPRRRLRPLPRGRRHRRGRRRRPDHGDHRRRPEGTRQAGEGHARRHGHEQPRAHPGHGRPRHHRPPDPRRRPLRARGHERARLHARRRAVRPHRLQRLRDDRRRHPHGPLARGAHGRDRQDPRRAGPGHDGLPPDPDQREGRRPRAPGGRRGRRRGRRRLRARARRLGSRAAPPVGHGARRPGHGRGRRPGDRRPRRARARRRRPRAARPLATARTARASCRATAGRARWAHDVPRAGRRLRDPLRREPAPRRPAAAQRGLPRRGARFAVARRGARAGGRQRAAPAGRLPRLRARGRPDPRPGRVPGGQRGHDAAPRGAQPRQPAVAAGGAGTGRPADRRRAARLPPREDGAAVGPRHGARVARRPRLPRLPLRRGHLRGLRALLARLQPVPPHGPSRRAGRARLRAHPRRGAPAAAQPARQGPRDLPVGAGRHGATDPGAVRRAGLRRAAAGGRGHGRVPACPGSRPGRRAPRDRVHQHPREPRALARGAARGRSRGQHARRHQRLPRAPCRPARQGGRQRRPGGRLADGRVLRAERLPPRVRGHHGRARAPQRGRDRRRRGLRRVADRGVVPAGVTTGGGPGCRPAPPRA